MQGTLSDTGLLRIAIFQGMTEQELKHVVDLADEIEFAPGEVILREGKRSQNIWIVTQGDCEVLKRLDDGDETVLATLESPSIFGEMSFFYPAPHSASVRALGEMRVLRIRREQYDLMVQQNNGAALKLAFNLANVLSERLRRMDDWVAQLIHEHADDGKKTEWRDFRAKLYGDWNI
jgi:CRP-like cAMP-binding protein